MISIFGIIPARAGSKRLPGKNLKLLNGQSLLERTIHQAKKALPVSVVSTEDSATIKEALRFSMPALLRPDSLATDDATSADVVRHAVNCHMDFEWFCLLQVTSPLRTVKDILNCVDMAAATGKKVVSVFDGKPNGAIYVGKTWGFDGDFTKDAIFYEMPKERSLDIDTQADFDEAERLLLELECTDYPKKSDFVSVV